MGEVLKLVEAREESRTTSLPEDFCWFWSEYPRKEKKGDAFKAWQQTKQIRPPVEEVIAAVDRYAEACRFKDRQYVMLPASWLRAWSWEDE
jgi:hypothetical protein